MSEPPSAPRAEVSVIVPAHNAAPFLDECFATIRAQTLAAIEILAVDDGSTDGTRALLAGYAERDRRVRLTALARNRGVSTARNLALDQATGRFVIFLDADDAWPCPRMLAALVAAADRTGADFVEFGFTRKRQPEPGWPDPLPGPIAVPLSEAAGANISYNVWAKLLRRSFVEAQGLRFDADLLIGEDALFAIRAYAVAGNVVRLPVPFYYHRINAAGAVRSPWTPQKVQSAAAWFARALAVADRCPYPDRQLPLRRGIVLERFRMLGRGLASRACRTLDDSGLRAFMALWAEPMAAAPPDYFRRFAPGEARAAELDELLRAVRSGDPAHFREVAGRHRRAARQTVTMTREQARALARQLGAAAREPVTLRLGDGRVMSLSLKAARRLAEELASSRQSRVILQLPDG